MTQNFDSMDDDDRLDALLRQANDESAPVPARLTTSIEHRLNVATWRRRIGATAALAASVGLVWLVSHSWRTTEALLPAKQEVVVAHVEARPPLRIRFPKDAPLIAVPIESDDPNVAIVVVYPTMKSTSKARSQQ